MAQKSIDTRSNMLKIKCQWFIRHPVYTLQLKYELRRPPVSLYPSYSSKKLQ